MILTYRNRLWFAQGSYDERHIPKRAGFRYDRVLKWQTADPYVAERLREYANPVASEALRWELASRQFRAQVSRAINTNISLAAPDSLAYLGFQRAGISYALECFERGVGCLIGDDMGTGKTMMAIGVIDNCDARRILVVCPASGKLYWSRKLRQWLTRDLSVAVASGDSFPDADVLVVNWDLLHRLPYREYDLVIADEVHRAKHVEARRSQALYAIPSRHRLALSGTPIQNRPVEFFPILQWLDPETWWSFWDFGMAYAAGHRVQIGWDQKRNEPKLAWDFSGASNLSELQERLRGSIMIRRTKAEVLPDLPPKFRTVLELPADGALMAIRAEWESYRGLKATGGDFAGMSHQRIAVALKKLPFVIDHVREALSYGKVILFAHHRAIQDRLLEAFEDCAVLHRGGMSMAEKDAAEQAFQEGDAQLFIGSIQASGELLTLTASHHVIFCEEDWVPGVITQCEDRCHRLTQAENVLVEHLVLEGSLDATMVTRLIEKQDNLDEALDMVAAA